MLRNVTRFTKDCMQMPSLNLFCFRRLVIVQLKTIPCKRKLVKGLLKSYNTITYMYTYCPKVSDNITTKHTSFPLFWQRERNVLAELEFLCMKRVCLSLIFK